MTAKEKYERIKFMHEIREKAKKIREARTNIEPICGYLKRRSDKALRHRTRTGWVNRLRIMKLNERGIICF